MTQSSSRLQFVADCAQITVSVSRSALFTANAMKSGWQRFEGKTCPCSALASAAAAPVAAAATRLLRTAAEDRGRADESKKEDETVHGEL